MAGAAVRRMHEKAITYLNRVVNEHPEHRGHFWLRLNFVTPGMEMGGEGRIDLPGMNGGGGDPGNNPQFAPEEEMRRQQERQRAQKRNISRPNL